MLPRIGDGFSRISDAVFGMRMMASTAGSRCRHRESVHGIGSVLRAPRGAKVL
jgi:hypothetical protein